jgi:hypothetical protein
MFESNRTNHAFLIIVGIIASAPFSGFAERLVPAAGHAASQRAYWTVKSEHVLSVTSRAAIRYQYNAAAGTRFWRTFLGTSCPGKIEVE